MHPEAVRKLSNTAFGQSNELQAVLQDLLQRIAASIALQNTPEQGCQLTQMTKTIAKAARHALSLSHRVRSTH